MGDEAFIKKCELDGGGDPIPRDPCPEDSRKLQIPIHCPCAGSRRCHSAGHLSSALPAHCALRPWTEQSPHHMQQAQGLCRVWGLSKGWQQPRAHPGQGRAHRVPRASSTGFHGWAAMATLPAAASVTKGDKLLTGSLPDPHVVGWPQGCPLQQIIWGSVGGKGMRVVWEQPLSQGGTAAAVHCSGLWLCS